MEGDATLGASGASSEEVLLLHLIVPPPGDNAGDPLELTYCAFDTLAAEVAHRVRAHFELEWDPVLLRSRGKDAFEVALHPQDNHTLADALVDGLGCEHGDRIRLCIAPLLTLLLDPQQVGLTGLPQRLGTLVWLAAQPWTHAMQQLQWMFSNSGWDILSTHYGGDARLPIHGSDTFSIHEAALSRHGNAITVTLQPCPLFQALKALVVHNATGARLRAWWHGGSAATIEPGASAPLRLPPADSPAQLLLATQGSQVRCDVSCVVVRCGHASDAVWQSVDDVVVVPNTSGASPALCVEPRMMHVAGHMRAALHAVQAAKGEQETSGDTSALDAVMSVPWQHMTASDWRTLMRIGSEEAPSDDEPDARDTSLRTDIVWRDTANTTMHVKEHQWLQQRLPTCRAGLAHFLRREPTAAKAIQLLQRDVDSDAAFNVIDTPVVAVAASGGGVRATACLGAVMDAMVQHELMPCVSYVAASGASAWCLAPWIASGRNPHHAASAAEDSWPSHQHHQHDPSAAHRRAGARQLARHGFGDYGAPFWRHAWARLCALLGSGKPVTLVDTYSVLIAPLLLRGGDPECVRFSRVMHRLGRDGCARVPIPVLAAVAQQQQQQQQQRKRGRRDDGDAFEWVGIAPWEAWCGGSAVETRALGCSLDPTWGRVTGAGGAPVDDLAYLLAVCASSEALRCSTLWQALHGRARAEARGGHALPLAVAKVLQSLIPAHFLQRQAPPCDDAPGLCSHGGPCVDVRMDQDVLTRLSRMAHAQSQRTPQHALQSHVSRFVNIKDEQDATKWMSLREAGADFNVPLPVFCPRAGTRAHNEAPVRPVDFVLCVDSTLGATDCTQLDLAMRKGYVAVRTEDIEALHGELPATGAHWRAFRPPPSQPHLPYIFYFLADTTSRWNNEPCNDPDRMALLCHGVQVALDRAMPSLRALLADCVAHKEGVLVARRARRLGLHRPVSPRTRLHGVAQHSAGIGGQLQTLSKRYCHAPLRPAALGPQRHLVDTDTFVAPLLSPLSHVRKGELFYAASGRGVGLERVWDAGVRRVVVEAPHVGSGGTALAHWLGTCPPASWTFRAVVTVRLPDVWAHVKGVVRPWTPLPLLWHHVLLAILTRVLRVPDPAAAVAAVRAQRRHLLWVLDGLHEVEHTALRAWCADVLYGALKGAAGEDEAKEVVDDWLCNVVIITRTNRALAVPRGHDDDATRFYSLMPWSMEQGQAYAERRFPCSPDPCLSMQRNVMRHTLMSSMRAAVAVGVRSLPLHWHLAAMLVDADAPVALIRSQRHLFECVERVVCPAADLRAWRYMAGCTAFMRARERAAHDQQSLQQQYEGEGLRGSQRVPSQRRGSMEWQPLGDDDDDDGGGTWLMRKGRFVHAAWYHLCLARRLAGACTAQALAMTSEVERLWRELDTLFPKGSATRYRLGWKGAPQVWTRADTAVAPDAAEALVWLAHLLSQLRAEHPDRGDEYGEAGSGVEQMVRTLLRFLAGRMTGHYYSVKSRGIISRWAWKAEWGQWLYRHGIVVRCGIQGMARVFAVFDDAVALEVFNSVVVPAASKATKGWVPRNTEMLSSKRLEICCLEQMAYCGCAVGAAALKGRLFKLQAPLWVNSVRCGGAHGFDTTMVLELVASAKDVFVEGYDDVEESEGADGHGEGAEGADGKGKAEAE